MIKIKIKNLELVRRMTQVISIIICSAVIPVFLIFLLFPDILIPNYTYDEDALLYIIYTILFIFVLALATGINAIIKRYIQRSMEENTNSQQQTTPPIVQHSANKNGENLNICPSCGAEILDKAGGFCSKCGASFK